MNGILGNDENLQAFEEIKKRLGGNIVIRQLTVLFRDILVAEALSSSGKNLFEAHTKWARRTCHQGNLSEIEFPGATKNTGKNSKTTPGLSLFT